MEVCDAVMSSWCFLGVKHTWVLCQMVCVSISKESWVVWQVRSTSFKLIARLLDFEEKWENKFKIRYKHGLSDCKCLISFLWVMGLV